jgi:hypothetical protein
MPQLYNLSLYEDATNIIDYFIVTDLLLKGYFSLFLVLVVGLFIILTRIKRNDDPVDAIFLGSFFSMMLAIMLYAANIYYIGINKPGLYIFIPAIIFISTAITKYYNKT